MNDSRFKSMFFQKPGTEIAEKAETRLGELRTKVEQRSQQMTDVTAKLGLTVTDLLENLDPFINGYSVGTNNTVGVSTHDLAKLKEDAQRIRNDKREIETLGRVIRNIDRNEVFYLTFEELTYFGF